MRTTFETSEDEKYTRNEWRWKIHSKRVKMKNTLEMSEDENYTRNEWRWETTLETSGNTKYKSFKLLTLTEPVHATTNNDHQNKEVDKVISKWGETTLETSEGEIYTRNEWRWKLHSKRVKMKTTLKTSEDEIQSNERRSPWICRTRNLNRLRNKSTLASVPYLKIWTSIYSFRV
jgi:hypothetical protein